MQCHVRPHIDSMLPRDCLCFEPLACTFSRGGMLISCVRARTVVLVLPLVLSCAAAHPYHAAARELLPRNTISLVSHAAALQYRAGARVLKLPHFIYFLSSSFSFAFHVHLAPIYACYLDSCNDNHTASIDNRRLHHYHLYPRGGVAHLVLVHGGTRLAVVEKQHHQAWSVEIVGQAPM